MSSKRRFHLGIDFGTSTSKVVFRDYGAPGGERAFLVLRGGVFRIPSRVCLTATEIVFGDDARSADTCDIYESIKMQAASELTGNPSYYFGPQCELPDGLTFGDLVSLVLWFLISEGERAISEYLQGHTEGVTIGMTMGVPMAFFKDSVLRPFFLNAARRAWLIYRGEGKIGTDLLIDKARRVLEKYPVSLVPPTPEYEVRDWIRSEGESAMWWPFHSPAVAPGPYAKVDIGAGTSHSSLYRIFGDSRTPKTGIAFFGAVTVPFGMDAVDKAIAGSQDLGGDCLALRGLEQSILQLSGKARGAIIPVREEIYESYRRAWMETFRKIQQYAAEIAAWRNHKIFTIGGGSLVPLLVDEIRIHPADSHVPVAATQLEPPPDLLRADGSKVTNAELPFAAVAYGLSNIGLSIPEAYTPDEVPPMPEKNERLAKLDRDDIYAK